MSWLAFLSYFSTPISLVSGLCDLVGKTVWVLVVCVYTAGSRVIDVLEYVVRGVERGLDRLVGVFMKGVLEVCLRRRDGRGNRGSREPERRGRRMPGSWGKTEKSESGDEKEEEEEEEEEDKEAVLEI